MRAIIQAFEWDAVGDNRGTDEVAELVLHVGPINGPGDELFTVHVCTTMRWPSSCFATGWSWAATTCSFLASTLSTHRGLTQRSGAQA